MRLKLWLIAATDVVLATAFLCFPAFAAPRPAGGHAQLDPTFGQRGIVLDATPKHILPSIEGLVVQPDGRPVVAAGERIVRYLGDGRRDPRFEVFHRGRTAGIALDPSGDLVRVSEDAIERLRPDGEGDPTFGGAGQVSVPGDDFTALAVQPDGKIVAAGTANPSGELVLLRLLPDGTADPEFGQGGTVVTPITPPGDTREYNNLRSLALTREGGIVVAGSTGYKERPCEHCPTPCVHCENPHAQAIVAKYTPNGQLESSFGEGGIVRTDLTWGSTSHIVARPDGQLLFLLGNRSGERLQSEAESPSLVVGALTSTGRWDPGFGTDGFVQRFVQINEYGPAGNAIALGPHGDLLFAGSEGGFAGEPFGFLLGALGRDGRPDPSFGTRGLLTTRLKAADESSGAEALAVGPHGGIVVAGRMPHHVVIARYRWNGPQ